MNAPALALPARWPLIARSHLRALFAGSGFLLIIVGITNVIWLIQGLLLTAPRYGLLEALHRQVTPTFYDALASLAPQPLAAAILNLAPPAGWRRVAHYVGTYIFLILWCWWVDPEGPFSDSWSGGLLAHLRWLASELETAVSPLLFLWAFSAYRTASRESDTLLQGQIAAATLDSQLQQARLQLLRAQIEPHFLFNTLATVRTLARSERAAAVHLIDNLMQYFAAALGRLRQEEATLADEMQLIDAYLGIYRVRMGSRLSYELDLPSELEHARIPTMILLTLVENALKHGVNPAVEGGHIRVRATRDRLGIVLEVADSGRGMQILEGQGSGLSNARTRLLMRYGDEASLSLTRGEPRGVVATVRIPLSSAA
jgi:two-component sensor histidine kinase